MHKTSFNPVPFPVKCISWKGKDSQKMHKKTESKISRPKHQQSTPIILQLRTNLQNSFFFWSTIPMVFFNDISSPILFFSFFYLNFFEPRANNQLWNFRRSVKSRTNRRRGTLLLSPLARFTRFTHSMEFLRKFFINSWTYVVDRMNRNRNVTFARTDRGTKHDWCRLSGTRLISSLSSPRMLIFLPFLPPRFSFVLCPFFVHRHVDLVKTRNVYLVE